MCECQTKIFLAGITLFFQMSSFEKAVTHFFLLAAREKKIRILTAINENRKSLIARENYELVPDHRKIASSREDLYSFHLKHLHKYSVHLFDL